MEMTRSHSPTKVHVDATFPSKPRDHRGAARLRMRTVSDWKGAGRCSKAMRRACTQARRLATQLGAPGRRWLAADAHGMAVATTRLVRPDGAWKRDFPRAIVCKALRVPEEAVVDRSRGENRTQELSKSALARMKVRQLRGLLDGMGLDSSGLKAELVERVWQHKERLMDRIQTREKGQPSRTDGADPTGGTAAKEQVDPAASGAKHLKPASKAQERSQGTPSNADSKADNPTGMELFFLGTSSGAPTTHRNVSCVALRLHTRVWLFDCGEATQSQILRAPLRQGKIEKIFITHLHGDHIFGLPGMLCTISNARHGGVDEELDIAKEPVKIYGPPGIQDFVVTALKVSQTKLIMPVEIYEYSLTSPASSRDLGKLLPIGRNGKIKVGKIYPSNGHPGILRGANGRLSWQGPDPPSWRVVGGDQDMVVNAGALRHRVACFGYVIQENDQPGRLDPNACEALGLPPGPLYKDLKNGLPVTMPDGRIISPEQVVGAPRPGRKVVVLGDTCDSRAIAPLARNADVLVHECTFSDEMKEKALIAGHSTASMAGEFARKIDAEQVILTHFSARYKIRRDMGSSRNGSEEEDDDLHAIPMLIKQARRAYQGRNVVAAHDFFHWKIPRKEANTIHDRIHSDVDAA